MLRKKITPFLLSVLDDLDSTLAQEQSSSSVTARRPLFYESRTPFSHFYSSGNRHGTIPGRHNNHHNEPSNMSIYDILRPGTPRESFKTFSPRTRTIYDMYRTRETRVFKEDYVPKNIFGSSSLCFDSRQRLASPAAGYFTARSLHFPSTTQNKNGFVPPSRQQSPKRTPLSSIIWNRSDSSRDKQNQGESPMAPSPMEIDPADQYMYPTCFQDNRRYGLYRSQSAYQSVSLNAPTDHAMSPDPLENSENMPFCHQANPFARSFFSNTFGRSQEQRFGQSPFGDQQEEHSSWSDFHQSRQPFTSSDRDFEMISTETNGASASHGHSVSSRHWEPFPPRYRTNISKNQEGPHPWPFHCQASTMESMEVSQGHGSKVTHFSTPHVCSMTDPSYHIKSGGLECQQDSSPVKGPINKEPYSSGIAQTLASSFKTSFPQIPDDKGNSKSPTFQNPAKTLQKIKPAPLLIRNSPEVTVPSSGPVDPSPLTDSQPSILVTEVTNEKDLNESVLEKDKQLNEMDHANTTDEIPQPISQTVISNPVGASQNPLSQDSTKSNRFVVNAATTVSSKMSPRVTSREDICRVHLSQSNNANDLKEGKSDIENRNVGSAPSPSFAQESRPPPSFPSPSQSCHHELRVRNGDNSRIFENNHRRSTPTDHPKLLSAEQPATADTEEEQRTKTRSANCRKSPAGHNVPRETSGPSSGTPPDPSPSDNSLLHARVVPSPAAFSERTPSGKDPSPGEREEQDNDRKNRNDHAAPSPSENPRSGASCVPGRTAMVDVVRHHSHPALRAGKVRGKVRQRVSCIEKLSKVGSDPTRTSDSSSVTDVTRSDCRSPELHTLRRPFPRKGDSFLTASSKAERKMVAPSVSDEPLALQMETPARTDTSNEPSPRSSVSEGGSDSVSAAPAAPERMADVGSASVRQGPLSSLTCRSGVPWASGGADEGENGLLSDTGACAVTRRPWEGTVNALQSVSSARGGASSPSPHLRASLPEGTAEEGALAASGRGKFSLSHEDPLPCASGLTEDTGGKTLHRFKTTSMVSVSGDEDHIRCLEVVSMYYTLPRKHSRTFRSLLHTCTPSGSSHADSAAGGGGACASASGEGRPRYCARERSRTPPPQGLTPPVSSARPTSRGLRHSAEDVTVARSPGLGPAGPTPQETSVGTDVSRQKGESPTGVISPDGSAATPLGGAQHRKVGTLQSGAPRVPPGLQGGQVTEEKAEPCRKSVPSSPRGPSALPAHSDDKVEDPQTGRSCGGCAGGAVTLTTSGSGKCLRRAVTGRAGGDGSDGSQPRTVRGDAGAAFRGQADTALSDAEGQVSALTPALHTLQLAERTCSRDADSLPSRWGELPSSGQDQGVDLTESSKAKAEMQRSAGEQPSLPTRHNKNKTSWDDLGKGKNRSSVKHRWAAMSQASRNFPAKDGSPRRHVATIFPQREDSSGFGGLPFGTPACNPLSSEPTAEAPEAPEPPEESSLRDGGADVEKSERPLAATPAPSRQAASHDPSPPHQHGVERTSEAPPQLGNSQDPTVAQILERESGSLAQPAFSRPGEADGSDLHRRRNPRFPLEPAEKATISIPLASAQQQQRRGASPGWDPESHPHRSKSLKSLSVHGDRLRKSHAPKARERHFSESTSSDQVLGLSRLTMGEGFSHDTGCGPRLKSFSEFSSCDENENWALYSGRAKTGPRSATTVSRPVDYGIFGKEQQLAFLDNVKRALTQGRLWTPSFLKNPGFLRDDVISPPNPTESSSSNSTNLVLGDGVSPRVPLNIYEEDPIDSDCDTDTTTDDEYYLDENDKESEL